MDPYTHGTYVSIDIRPHGIGVRPPQCPKHPDEGPSVIRPWSPSMEERTSGRRLSNPHVCHSDDPCSHRQSPSKPCTTRPGSATIVPAPNGNLSYERPRPIRSSLHIWGKTPRCVKMPGLTDDEHLFGGAPLPSPVSASF